MDKITELREKRVKAWEAAKAFLDSHTDADGKMSAEDAAAYDKMEADMVELGKSIERLEKQEAMDKAMAQPVAKPIMNQPAKDTAV